MISPHILRNEEDRASFNLPSIKPLPAEAVQPDPQPTTGPAIWPLVIQDFEKRNEVGTAKYGVPLRAGNGRDPLLDLYQELLDAVVYLRQALEERKK